MAYIRISSCVVWNWGISLICFIALCIFLQKIRQCIGDKGLITLLLGVSALGLDKIIYDIFKPLVLKSKNKKLNEESESRQQNITMELTKERKSMQEIIDDGSMKVYDVEELKKEKTRT